MKKVCQTAAVKIIGLIVLLVLFTVPFLTTTYGKNVKEYEVSTGEELISAIKDAMIGRETKFQVYYEGNYKNLEKWLDDEDGSLFLYDIFNSDDPNNPDDADYLKFNYDSTRWQVQGGYNELTFEFETSYYTSKEDEEYVSKTVEKILNKLNLNGKTTYEKVKVIYDYIISNVEYDESEDDDNLRMYSAYAGLADGKMVCNGYALLLYKMLTAVNVECKIISGLGDGGYHAWNIVKIGDYWYNVDITWDDPGKNRRSEYEFFLKSNHDFPYHQRDKEYNTKSFLTKYPMSATSYKVSGDSISLNKTNATIKKDGKITLKAILSNDTKVTWKSSNSKIATVSKNGVVKGIKKGKVTITAKTASGKSVTCVITVK